jgi:hypothetical protein
MTTAVRRSEPVTIEAFDKFVEAQADTALFELVEGVIVMMIDIDRGPKLDFYKSLPTLRHIALIYQDQMRVEHYRRSEQGFELNVLKRAEEALHFEAVESRIDLARICFDVAL